MPKDILPELRLADVAELAPTANVQPETFLFNFAREQNLNEFLEASNQDGVAQVNGVAVQGSGTRTSQMCDDQVNNVHKFSSNSSFTQGIGPDLVTRGTNVSPSATFTDSSPQNLGAVGTQTSIYGTPTNFRNVSSSSKPEGSSAHVDSQVDMSDNGHSQPQPLSQQIGRHPPQGALGSSQLTGVPLQLPGSGDGQLEGRPGMQQCVSSNPQPQVAMNSVAEMGMSTTQPMGIENPQQIPGNRTPVDANEHSQMGMTTAQNMHLSSIKQLNMEQQIDRNQPQQMEVNIQQEMGMNVSQQMRVNTEQEFNSPNQMGGNGLQLSVNTQQQNANSSNNQQHLNINPPHQINLAAQQQIGLNPQQQMCMKPGPQMEELNSPKQQMGINQQEMGVNTHQLGSPQQQMVVNQQQQMCVNAQEVNSLQQQMAVNQQQQQQMCVNAQEVNSLQQQMVVNQQQQQQQMCVNAQEVNSLQQQMVTNPPQQMGVNTQQLSSSQQQMGLNQQICVNTPQLNSPPQQMGLSQQQQMYVNTQQMNSSQQQMGLNQQQQMHVNTQQLSSPQQQMNMNQQQQQICADTEQVGPPQHQIRVNHEQLNTPQQQIDVNTQQMNSSQPCQQQMGFNQQQQMCVNAQQQMGMNQQQQMCVNAQQLGSPQQQMDMNQQQQMCANTEQLGSPQQQMDMNQQQQQMCVNTQQLGSLQQQMDMNQQQQQMCANTEQLGSPQQQMDMNQQQQQMCVNTQQLSPPQQQMGMNQQQQQQMCVNTQQLGSPQQQMGMNQQQQQQIGVNTQQLSPPQQQIGLNQQQQLDLIPHQHIVLSPPGQGINSPEQLDMNTQQQMDVNTQQQMDVNAQMDVNTQQQMRMNLAEQNSVNSQQQMIVNSNHSAEKTGMNAQFNMNPQQQIDRNTQQQVDGNTQPQTALHPPYSAHHQDSIQQISLTQQSVSKFLQSSVMTHHSKNNNQQALNSDQQQLNMDQQGNACSNAQQLPGVNIQQVNANPQQQLNMSTGHPVNNSLQQFRQTQMSTPQHMDSQQVAQNPSQHPVAPITQQLSPTAHSPTVKMEATVPCTMTVFTNPLPSGTAPLKQEAGIEQHGFSAGFVYQNASNTDISNNAQAVPSSSESGSSNQFIANSNCVGNNLYPLDNDNIPNTKIIAALQNEEENLVKETMKFLIEQNGNSSQNDNLNLNANAREMICATDSEIDQKFNSVDVSQHTSSLSRQDGGQFMNPCQTSPGLSAHLPVNTDQSGNSQIGTADPALPFTCKLPVLDQQYQTNSANDMVNKPTSFQFVQQHSDTPSVCPTEVGPFRGLYPDSNSSSQHVSRNTSGQASPSNLGSPRLVSAEGDGGQCSPVQSVPRTSGTEFNETLFSRLIGTFKSSEGTCTTSSSSTPSSHQPMDHDTNSQASLVAMSEQLKIMDSGCTNTFNVPMGSDFDILTLNILNEDTVFDVDLAQKGQSPPATTSQTAAPALSFASQLGLTAPSTGSFTTTTVDSLPGGCPTRPLSIEVESDSTAFNFRKPSNEPPRTSKKHRRSNKKLLDASLCQQFPASSNGYQLKIVEQPEDQHRARYKTEGSRGSVKDRSQQGHPTVKLLGIHQSVTLQVFVGNDSGKVKPHGFYQACKVCGKNSTACSERDIDGTTVIELQLDPTTDMLAKIDCVGILKLRNADVEQRMGVAKAKKKSLKARLVFRVSFKCPDGGCQTLQVASHPILCTQPIGMPEICKKSLTESSVDGGGELFMIGKNFMKGTKVLFQELGENGENIWEAEGAIDTDYFQNTHLICSVPAYRNLAISSPAVVQIVVRCSGKTSYPQTFSYLPKVKQESMETETCAQKAFFNKVSPAALHLNGMISHSSGVFQLPADVARTILAQKKTMKMETNQDNPACSNIIFSPPAQAAAPTEASAPTLGHTGPSLILPPAPAWTSSAPLLLTMANMGRGQTGSNFSSNQCVQPTLPSYIVVPPAGLGTTQASASGQAALL